MLYIQTYVRYPDIYYIQTYSVCIFIPTYALCYIQIYMLYYSDICIISGYMYYMYVSTHIYITNQITDFLIYDSLFTFLFSHLLTFRWKYRGLIELCYKNVSHLGVYLLINLKYKSSVTKIPDRCQRKSLYPWYVANVTRCSSSMKIIYVWMWKLWG